ncbi:hypothetical protein ACC758_23795 [Rhizobium ruizarguesonis]
MLILSGSKGFAAPAYDEIGQAFKAAGLNAYLVHVLSPGDLGAIATASGAQRRIAYSEQHLSDRILAVQGVVAYLKGNRALAARSKFWEFPFARKSLGRFGRAKQYRRAGASRWRSAERSLSIRSRPSC